MLYIRLLVSLSLVLFVSTSLSAQFVSPWFRQAAGISFKEVQTNAFTLERVVQSSLSRPVISVPTKYAVKTTLPNWLSHKLYRSHAISAMEKQVLRQSPGDALLASAKLQFFFDRDLLLAKTLPATEPENWNETAFKRHQDLLQSTRTEVEIFGAEQIAWSLEKDVSFFTKNDIQNILLSGQPPSFILTSHELKEFPTLSLEQQRQFAQSGLEAAQQQLVQFLCLDPTKISAAQFTAFYRSKCQWYYFFQLTKVLQTATEPRKTAIVRVYKPLNIDFLPDPQLLLTDAQRLGKLQFYLDFYTQDQANLQRAELLQAEQLRQGINRPYAKAEALDIPYEKVLGGHVLHDEDVFNQEMVSWLQSTPYKEQLPWLDQLLLTQTDKMAAFRKAHPNPTVADYTAYYRLLVEKEYLQGARSKAHLFSGIE